jgi:hypothetical protein
VAAALLLMAALGLFLGVTSPARRARDASWGEFARAREERERLRSRLAALERRAATVRAPSGDAAAARALRLCLLEATRGLDLGSVQIGAQAGRRGTVAARGRLTVEGGQADLLRSAERLADPASGVLLDRVSLRPARDGALRMELEAFSLRGEP